MKEHMLSVEHLSVFFENNASKVCAVKDVNFFLDEGEILAIVGESGCGKSVTAKSIMGLLSTPPAQYSNESAIKYQGTDLLKLTEKQLLSYRGKEISLVSQDSLSGLNPTMTVGKQICECIMAHKKVSFDQAKAMAIEKISKVRLPDPENMFYRYPHTLSGGQRQRIMIAMAMSCDPKIILADEPTTALDPTIQKHILNIFCELKSKRNIAVVLITHDLRVASAIADRIAVMYGGTVVESGRVNDLLQKPSHPYTRGLLSSLIDWECAPKTMLYSISGSPLISHNPSNECDFVSRCPYAMNICAEMAPPLYKIDEDHICRCWLQDPRSPVIKILDQIQSIKDGVPDDR